MAGRLLYIWQFFVDTSSPYGQTYMQGRALGFILMMIVGASSSAPFDGTLWDNPSPTLPPGVTHGKYRSTSMATEIGYNVYLPPEYGSSHLKRFPVIYFLHGRAGDENTELE